MFGSQKNWRKIKGKVKKKRKKMKENKKIDYK